MPKPGPDRERGPERRPGKALGALLALALCAAPGQAAADCHRGTFAERRFVERFVFPDARTVGVVAEGECEAASIGSYGLRIYSGNDPRFPTDDFIAGLVRPRDGAVEGVNFHDVDDDGKGDIVVTIRSAGSAGFLSGDAFRYRDGALTLLATVGRDTDLHSNADVLQALRRRLAAPAR
ncbi:MAG: hypothetical protein OXU54_07190 [Gammaproteobacteria bacterium]|nr:hypothetical protein [Gammaproteobacteria bacterium]